MLSLLKKSRSSSRLMSDMGEAGEEEMGAWSYLVVDPGGIRPRRDASYSKEAKSGSAHRLKEGTVVDINCKRRSGCTRWLCLSAGGGWVHDVCPKHYRVRLAEVEVLKGDWHYQVCCDRVFILPRPSLTLATKPTKGMRSLEFNEVVVVNERIRPLSGKGSFLQLADGSGFIFDVVKGQQAMNRCPPPNPPSANFSETTQAADPGENWDDRPASPTILRVSTLSDLGVPEYGAWDYVVLDPTGISLRRNPTYDKAAKLPSRLAEGEIVQAVERRAGNGTTFLRIQNPPGWVFDVQPGLLRRRLRMEAVSVKQGAWFYRVCAPKGIALRSRCSLAEDCKIGRGPSQGALLEVSSCVEVSGTMFMRLKDGSGWVFECKDGRRLLEGPVNMQRHDQAFASVRPREGLQLLAAPTKSRWAQSGKWLLAGARVQLLRTCEVEGEVWSYVSPPGGGMEGWSFGFNFEAEEPSPAPEPSSAKPAAQPAPPRSFDAELVRRALHAPSPVSVF